ncbi:hypothetical protein ACHAWF_004716 [Thalassiosira exigua]
MTTAAAASAQPTMESSSPPSSSPPDEEDLHATLASFLSSSRSDLRRSAASATLASLCSSDRAEAEATARRLAALGAVASLCKIASESSDGGGGTAGGEGGEATSASDDALASLSALCAHDAAGNQCVEDFVDAKGVGRAIEVALSRPPPPAPSGVVEGSPLRKKWEERRSSWRRRVNFACALLANATRTERGAAEFVGYSLPEEAVPSSVGGNDDDDEGGEEKKEKPDSSKPAAALLLARFLNPAFVDASKAMEGDASADSDDEFDSDSEDELPEATSADASEPARVRPTSKDEESYDPYQYLAAVMTNVAQLETGRDFLMRLIYPQKKALSLESIDEAEGESGGNEKVTATSHLQSLLPHLRSPNVRRRRGVAGAIKNCCFSRDSEWWLLHVVRIDKHLLTSLAGPEELDVEEKVGLDPDYWLLGPKKVREPDAEVRLRAVEALLLLLASGRRARDALRERRTYVIIKLADMVEEDERVSERMLECVQYLRRDEEGSEEGSSDKRAYERYAGGLIRAEEEEGEDGRGEGGTDGTRGKGPEGEDVDYDDVD